MILQGDCRERMAEMEENSIDAIVCDPPYELGFMGKKWDGSGIAYDQEVWRQAWRVLKPGGYLLAFGGTRTYHRLACAIEDAGFEIRDSIHWCYGSGFPKSLDISKQLDRTAAKTSEDVKKLKDELRRVFDASGLTLKELNSKCGFEASGYLRKSSTWGSVLPTVEKWQAMRNAIGTDEDFSFEFKEIEREVIGKNPNGFGPNKGASLTHNLAAHPDITAPATDAARQWDGWGTALKPAHEPIVMARKPLSEKTVAANVLRWGCGAVNIDASRVESSGAHGTRGRKNGDISACKTPENPSGRWPANLILGHAPGCVRRGEDCVEGCAVRLIAEQSGQSKPNARANKGGLKLGYNGGGTREVGTWDISDEGTAARFFLNIDPDPLFYCAKVSRAERNRGLEGMNHHPTVKPLKLMRYLVRLVTPPGGTVLDPFAGSGTTLIAAKEEGFNFIGIELEPEYVEIAEARLAAADRPPATLEDFAT